MAEEEVNVYKASMKRSPKSPESFNESVAVHSTLLYSTLLYCTIIQSKANKAIKI